MDRARWSASDADDHLVRLALRAVIVGGVADPGGVDGHGENYRSKVTHASTAWQRLDTYLIMASGRICTLRSCVFYIITVRSLSICVSASPSVLHLSGTLPWLVDLDILEICSGSRERWDQHFNISFYLASELSPVKFMY